MSFEAPASEGLEKEFIVVFFVEVGGGCGRLRKGQLNRHTIGTDQPLPHETFNLGHAGLGVEEGRGPFRGPPKSKRIDLGFVEVVFAGLM
jgi:hypothetical protein